MAGNGAKALTVVVVSVLSWYSGLKFWKPLVVEHLKQDGALRTDIDIDDTDDSPKSWSDLQYAVKTTLHPSKKDEWDLQHKTNLEENLKVLREEAAKSSTK